MGERENGGQLKQLGHPVTTFLPTNSSFEPFVMLPRFPCLIQASVSCAPLFDITPNAIPE